jgi:lipopolysaccharide biosynthesis regulator YciM
MLPDDETRRIEFRLRIKELLAERPIGPPIQQSIEQKRSDNDGRSLRAIINRRIRKNRRLALMDCGLRGERLEWVYKALRGWKMNG